MLCLIVTLFIISSFKGQTLQLNTNKDYTLNQLTESKFLPKQEIKPIDLNTVFSDKRGTINKERFKYTPYELNDYEAVLGEVGYLFMLMLTVI